MALPKAIQDQLDAAEAIQQQLQNPTAEPETVQSNQEPEQPAEPTPDPQPAEPQPQPQVTPPEPSEPEPDWKQRAKTLEGKYNAEVPRLHGQLKDLNSQLSQALEEIHKLKTAQPTPPEPRRQELITKDDEETFGSDLIDLSRRVVREEFAQLAPQVIGELRKEFAPIREQVGEVQKETAQTKEDRFWTSVDSAVPDWREIDQDPQWLEWLGEVDPMVGKTRQEALNDAHNSLDAARVASIFKVWKGAFRPEQPAPQPTNQKREELQRQVAPSKSRAATTAPAPERTWTAAEYERAFDPRLSATMGADEISKLQADADKAYAEGRVKW